MNRASKAIACDTFADLLVDLSDGELTPQERQPILDHVAVCERCRTHLARLSASRELLTAAITPATSRVGQARQSEPRPTRSTSRQQFALAIALLLFLALSTAWLTTIKSPPPALTAQPTPPASAAPPKLTKSQALWQITLLEQQARLQTSLDFLPDSPAFADQRQKNEQLLIHYKSLLSTSNL
jgi:anti-sigma factor RsiW